ncbi:MAG TPA: DUF2268 domain-containing putative Zn-dependent protease [Longimicrobiaceae bacterium]|nr:DUF2268 domain-containing putative Zn-dependent protease [Longimicrobiaceae bacterium]
MDAAVDGMVAHRGRRRLRPLWVHRVHRPGCQSIASMQAVMFGDPRQDLPPWTGYSVGYRLVNQRMQQDPAMDIATMTAAPTSAFIPDGTD